MEEKSLLIKLTGEMPLFRILDFLIDNKGLEFTKDEIIDGSGISRSSLFNYWEELESHNIIKVTKQMGKTKLYTLNMANEVTKRLVELEKALIAEALEKEQVVIVSA